MKKLLLALFAFPLFAQFGAPPDFQGLWDGTLVVGASKLRLIVHLTRDGSGGFSGKLDSVDQGAMGIPITNVVAKERSLILTMTSVGATYTGAMNAGGTRIEGTWKQSVPLPLTLSRIENAPVLERPQEPKKPYPYREEEVTVLNAEENVKLAGTLTTPSGAGPFPAVFLITGSGPQDRDETLLGHRPFLIIADYLTRHGIAVLRVDDRGVAKSTGDFAKATSADFAADTIAGVHFLKAHPAVDHAHIGLLGHSEGGIIAPLAASQSSDVAFLVLMAGTAVPGDQVLVEQQRLIAKAMGVPDELAAQNREISRKMIEVSLKENDPELATKKMYAVLNEAMSSVSSEQREALKPILEGQMKAVQTPWFRYFLTYDPGPILRKTRIPVLALNGELDLQVSAKQNLPVIAKELEAAGNPDYEIVKLGRLNHLFQTARTGSPAEYMSITETIAPAALDAIATWILRHTSK